MSALSQTRGNRIDPCKCNARITACLFHFHTGDSFPPHRDPPLAAILVHVAYSLDMLYSRHDPGSLFLISSYTPWSRVRVLRSIRFTGARILAQCRILSVTLDMHPVWPLPLCVSTSERLIPSARRSGCDESFGRPCINFRLPQYSPSTPFVTVRKPQELEVDVLDSSGSRVFFLSWFMTQSLHHD